MEFQLNRAYILIITLGCFFNYSCAGIPVQQPLLPVLKDPASYFKEVIKKSRSISDVSGYAKISIHAPGQKSNTSNIFFVKRPDRLRVETLGFLSRPALFFAATGEDMSIYVVQDNTLYSGLTSAENFVRIIGMRLELPEIVASFLGQPPLAESSEQKLSCSVDGNQYLFTIEGNEKKQMLWVEPAFNKITKYRSIDKTFPVYEFVFSDFQQIEHLFFPLKIHIHHYTYTTDISIELESLSFAAIPEDRFSIPPPHGANCFDINKLGSPN